MGEKTKYVARIFDRRNGIIAEITGTNKEVVLRNSSKVARGSKTQHHYKNDISIFVNLYNQEELKKDAAILPIRTMRF